MSFIQNFYTSRDNKTDGNTYVGQEGRLWYNPNTNSIYVNTANVVGGTPVALATGANIVANNITVNTITSTSGTVNLTGNLVLTGNISPAGPDKIGGIFPGPGVVISNQGELTIDTANLPLSFGNFTASNNILTIVNSDENMILETQGNAEIQLIGNIGFYRTDGNTPSGQYFQALKDGQITIYVPDSDPQSGAVKIIGSQSGNYSPPLNTGVMLQLTGQNNDASRLYNDSVGGFAAFVGRRVNGNVSNPTAIVAGDEIIRISSTGYDGTEIPGSGTARIVYQAMENYTPTARGSNLSLWATAIASNVLTQIATVDVANGVNATKFTTSGTISATGNISGGNINTTNISLTGNVIGNIITGGIVSATGNITGGNLLTANSAINTNISTTGNIIAGYTFRYNVATNNASATQLTNKATPVTCNGRTGQITTSNASLAKGAAVTFTVNNTYITAATDVVIVNLASGATIDAYAVAVTNINSAGSFNITLTNNGAGPLTDTIVINFAIIKVS